LDYDELDYDVLDGWDDELFLINHGKIGEPYAYPDSFIRLLGYMRAYFHLLYRQTQGIVMVHASTKVPCIPDYSTISRRVNRLEINIIERLLGNDIVIALDGKLANRGEWILHKWHVRKGYLKIHVAVDIKKRKRILSLEVTSEEVHDGRMLSKKINNTSSSKNYHVKGVLADGMYDCNDNFRYISKNHIKAGVKTRSNSKVRPTNCQSMNVSVMRQPQEMEAQNDLWVQMDGITAF
jgi:hypothetical protein